MVLLQALVIFIDLLDGDVHIILRDVLIPFKIVDNAIRMLAAAAFPIDLLDGDVHISKHSKKD